MKSGDSFKDRRKLISCRKPKMKKKIFKKQPGKKLCDKQRNKNKNS